MGDMNGETSGLSKGLLIGLLTGSAVGAALALLFAPKSGRELRSDISTMTNDYVDKMGDMLDNASERAQQIVNDGRTRAETIIDDARRENAFGLMMSLNMLIEFGEAFDYTGADFDKWCKEVGFDRTEVVHLAGPASAAIAYK